MIPSSEETAIARPPRVPRSAAEKNRAVKAFKARGDRTVKALCASLGVSQPVLYHWVNLVEKNGPFSDKPSSRTAITKVSATRSMPAHDLAIKTEAVQLSSHRERLPSASEREELVLLRADNARLRAALISALELKGEVYGKR